MSITLGDNRYGKSGIHLVVVQRDQPRHAVTDLRVDVRLEGDFEAAHTEGDNASVLPTDTMRGTVFAFARRGPVDEPEEFGLRLARHLVDTAPTATAAEIRLAATRWSRIGEHPSGFLADTSLVRTAAVRVEGESERIRGGVEGVNLLKTAGSAFSGFYRDAYTTLAETDDRLLATTLTADWGYADHDVNWAESGHATRGILLESFAAHDSRSVQHTLYAMGQAVLRQRPEITDIHLLLPNRHHLLVDLSPYGLDNPNQVFVATEEPHGVIEATVSRRRGRRRGSG